MDALSEWGSYWGEITASSFNWAVTLWPIQTVAFGVVIVVITTGVFWRLGKREEVKNIAIGFFVSLIVSIVAFVIFVILVGPFLHSEGGKAKLAELDQLRTDKANFDTTIKELKAQRDDAINRLKLSEEAMDIQNSEIGKLRRELGDAGRQLDDKKASMAEKVARNTLKGKFLIYLHSAQIIKQNCLSGLKDYSPMKEFEEWYKQTVRELRDLGDGSYMFRFSDTPPPNARSHYEVGGKPVSEECNQVAKVIDIKQAVLKDFIAELSR